MSDLAYALGPPPSGGPGGGFLAFAIQMVPLVAILLIFYFLLIRPQQKQRREREEMLRNLKRGDRIVTAGGLIGTIVGLSPDTVTLKIADSVRVECLRSAVTGLRSEAKADQDSA